MSTLHIAKVFQNGRSQAVRLPKEFRFNTTEVYIEKRGNCLILSPKPTSWDDFFDSPLMPSADFMLERIDLPPQIRELFE